MKLQIDMDGMGNLTLIDDVGNSVFIQSDIEQVSVVGLFNSAIDETALIWDQVELARSWLWDNDGAYLEVRDADLWEQLLAHYGGQK